MLTHCKEPAGYLESQSMVERAIELRRRHARKKKMKNLKTSLATVVAGPDREKVLYKIKRLSPWWTEASLTQTTKSVATAAPQGERKSSAPKSKGPARGAKPEGKK